MARNQHAKGNLQQKGKNGMGTGSFVILISSEQMSFLKMKVRKEFQQTPAPSKREGRMHTVLL